MRAPGEKWATWIEAAHVHGPSLNGWVVRELDAAAQRVLAEQRRVADAQAERERVQAAMRPFRPDFKEKHG